MLLLLSKNIHFMYPITILDSLLKGLQEFLTLKQIIFLEIGLKCIRSDCNQGLIIQKIHTWGDCKKHYLIFYPWLWAIVFCL